MRSPSELVAEQDRQLREELRRERRSNEAFARKCPGVRETECYRRGPTPASQFYTTRDVLIDRIERERYRFNPARCRHR